MCMYTHNVVDKMCPIFMLQVAPLIKKCVVLNGSLMIGYQPLNHRKLPNFFRLVLSCHPARCESDLDKVISEIEAAGRDLEV